MSHKLLQMVKRMNLDQLEIQLALQCAPLIVGIKISNLLIVPIEDLERVKQLFEGTKISNYLLYKGAKKAVILLYKEDLLLQYLNRSKVREIMAFLGYQSVELTDVLRKCAKQYSICMDEKGAFPHEMGLLLGYPPNDVKAFIENNGKGFLYSGYWKVYDNVSEALKLFEGYEKAREKVLGMLSSGMKILDILDSNDSNESYQIII